MDLGSALAWALLADCEKKPPILLFVGRGE